MGHELIIRIIELLGTFAFAISGIRHAAAKQFDWFGGYVCGVAVAIGGGTIRDVMLGMIPFYIGDVIDFFHRANSQNMQLISGFVNGDKEVIHEVNRKAWASAIFIALSLVITALLIWATVEITSWLFNSIMK